MEYNEEARIYVLSTGKIIEPFEGVLGIKFNGEILTGGYDEYIHVFDYDNNDLSNTELIEIFDYMINVLNIMKDKIN